MRSEKRNTRIFKDCPWPAKQVWWNLWNTRLHLILWLQKLYFLRAELAAHKQRSVGPSPPSPPLPSPPFSSPRSTSFLLLFALGIIFAISEILRVGGCSGPQRISPDTLLLCLGSNESGIETLKLSKIFYLSYLQSFFFIFKIFIDAQLIYNLDVISDGDLRIPELFCPLHSYWMMCLPYSFLFPLLLLHWVLNLGSCLN